MTLLQKVSTGSVFFLGVVCFIAFYFRAFMPEQITPLHQVFGILVSICLLTGSLYFSYHFYKIELVLKSKNEVEQLLFWLLCTVSVFLLIATWYLTFFNTDFVSIEERHTRIYVTPLVFAVCLLLQVGLGLTEKESI